MDHLYPKVYFRQSIIRDKIGDKISFVISRVIEIARLHLLYDMIYKITREAC